MTTHPTRQETKPVTQKTVAIAEDESSVRQFIAHVLKCAGYRTIEARNAVQAKQLIQEHPESVALMISDIRMPGGNGLDLGVDLQAANLHIPILYISGLIDSVAVQSILLNKPLAILTKPFTAQVLAERVRVLIGSAISSSGIEPSGELAESKWPRKGPGTATERRGRVRKRAS
jgi:DNA-binding response OmpR family regulator